MTKLWLSSALLVACASSQPTQTATTPTTAPSVRIEVWSQYRDFGAHGISANGRTFVHDANGWTSSECTHESTVQCTDRTPVARSMWPALDAITSREVFCEQTPDVCRQLGVEVPAPKTIVVVWSTYMDFSGHGFNGSGRFYARDGAGWSSIDCSVSHVSDPHAGPQPKQETCDARKPVPEALWPAVEAIAPKPGYEENDVMCAKVPDVCTTLGVPIKPLG